MTLKVKRKKKNLKKKGRGGQEDGRVRVRAGERQKQGGHCKDGKGPGKGEKIPGGRRQDGRGEEIS